MKKIVSAICAVMTIICAATPTMVTTAVNRYVGDVNEDGFVDSTDASEILKEYAAISTGGQLTVQFELADVNCDGRIDSSDASEVLQMYAAALTGEKVDYRVVSTSDDISIEINDLIEVTPIYLYTVPNASTENLYAEKNYLSTGDRFAIVEAMSDSWYRIQLSFNQKEDVYVQLPGEILKKVGTVIIDNPVSTTATTTTTTATTTKTSTTTTTETTTTEETTTTTTTTAEAINPTISVGSIVEFTVPGGSWYVHDKITDDMSGDFYAQKATLVEGDRFIILQVADNCWYAVSLDNSGNTAYLRISEESMSKYFKKVGETAVEVEPSVTTTTEETTTTTTTTAETTTTTETTTTEPVTTPIETSTTQSFNNWECVRFAGEGWSIHSTPEMNDSNITDYLNRDEYFFIKEVMDDNWYKIVSSNINEESQYIRVTPGNLSYFNVEESDVYRYTGEVGWNIRTSMSLEEDNIVGSLQQGDIFIVNGFFGDGWAWITSNKLQLDAFIKMEAPQYFMQFRNHY
ncbi:MAG: hypothetical protein IJ690_04000 [Clostridia bacterium]|nr:hypothetical protein [Clostridia bacterium]